MRLFATIIILLILPCALFAAVEKHRYTPFLVLGHVDTSLTLSVNIDNSVLPIDFSDERVKFNDNLSVAAGLRIGSYSVISNVSFNLYIAHTPFMLKTPTEASDGIKLEEIDYVLYVISNMSTGEFSYCYGSQDASNPAQIAEANKSILITKYVNNGLARMVDHSMFLSLDDEDELVSTRLRAGLYESTVYFVLESE